jgi:hypothetical protein
VSETIYRHAGAGEGELDSECPESTLKPFSVSEAKEFWDEDIGIPIGLFPREVWWAVLNGEEVPSCGEEVLGEKF